MVQSGQLPPANPESSRSGEKLRLWSLRSFRILVGVTTFFLVLAGGCFLSPWLAELLGSIIGSQFPQTEFPLSDPRNVAVDSQGRIYVSENAYYRVQRYSANGEFERGWWVSGGNYSFALRTTPDDRVQIATAGDELLTYSPDGELISSERTGKEDLASRFQADMTTSGGYEIRKGLISRVVDSRTGRTVIQAGWPEILLMYPFPGTAYWLIALLGMTAAFAWAWYEQRKSRTTKAPANSPS